MTVARVCLVLALCVAALFGAPPRAGAAAGRVQINVLSNRADLISGGDALVQVVPPARVSPARLRIELGGRDVNSAFAVRPDGRFEGLVTGLAVGRNVLTVRLPDGSGGRIAIANHPIGGPVFAGAQVQPWVCGTQAAGLGPPTDAQCNAPTSYSYVYKSSSSGQFQSYDPKNPPSDVAMTTTDAGVTVPYVVRVEEGTQDRGLYETAVLFDPSKAWAPWAPQPGWNHKLMVPFGASTAPHHSQDPPTAVTPSSSAPTTMIDDSALSLGFMVADSGLNIQGSDANANVSAEALMMLKEHIAETYGAIRYTIGEGCSGGGLQQYMIAAMYPGLLNGIQPNCSFTDMWSTAADVGECHGLDTYFTHNPNQPWVPSIDGHHDPSDCQAWDQLFFPVGDPTRASNCNLPQSDVYDPNTNPRGARCDLQDYQAAIWGPRPPSEWGPVEKRIGSGFAERPVDNIGVQYGLQALKAGSIAPAEFADLNAKAGGVDIDNHDQPQRTEMNAQAAATAYRTGQITDARQLAAVPIIDLRAYSESAEIHTSYYSYKMRARLDKENGGHANQIIWTFPSFAPVLGVVPPPDIALKSFLLMDRWLAGIEADRSTAALADKVIRHKPADAVDACFPENTNVEVTDQSTCATTFPHYGNTRTASGAPVADDVIKCWLKPFATKDYPVPFTPSELAQLAQAFPTGVCDYSKPGVGQQPSIPWITFAGGPGGRPLGAAPSSTAFAASSARRPRLVLRVAYARRRAGQVCSAATATVSGRDARTVRRVDFLVGKRRVARDARAPWRHRVPRGRRAYRLRARVVRRGGTPLTLVRLVRGCGARPGATG
jgi:hypothetical protein